MPLEILGNYGIDRNKVWYIDYNLVLFRGVELSDGDFNPWLSGYWDV
jgi:hypothetical protein